MVPFLSLLTPTYRRPAALARNLSSVRGQTAVADIEQLVVPDHVGQGVVGMLTTVPLRYGAALTGRYVAVLGDDDILASPDAVARLRAFAERAEWPGVIVVRVFKSGLDLPLGPHWPPVCGCIDLACLVVRRDLWLAHLGDYGARYEGDYDFAAALHRAGHDAAYCHVVFAACDVGKGQSEEVA